MKTLSRPVLLLLAFVVAPLTFAQTASLDKDKANMAKLEKNYKLTKTAFAKKPKSEPLRKKYADATVAFGTATMMTGTLSPHAKYAGALHLYREALKVDPHNAEALKNKKMIEDIYQSMGRPIPK